MRTKFLTASLLGFAGLLLSSVSSYAQNLHVVINTSSLSLAPNAALAPYSLDFQLNSGNTLGNNTAVLSNFAFGGGGAPFGAANAIGGVTGSLPGSVSLADTFAFNEFYQSFQPGSILSFDLSLSQNVDAGPTPDAFSISILDNALANIPTSGISSGVGANVLGFVDLPGNLASFQTFTGTGDYAGVTLSITPVPEPATYGLIAGVLAVVGVAVRRYRDQTAKVVTV